MYLPKEVFRRNMEKLKTFLLGILLLVVIILWLYSITMFALSASNMLPNIIEAGRDLLRTFSSVG